MTQYLNRKRLDQPVITICRNQLPPKELIKAALRKLEVAAEKLNRERRLTHAQLHEPFTI